MVWQIQLVMSQVKKEEKKKEKHWTGWIRIRMSRLDGMLIMMMMMRRLQQMCQFSAAGTANVCQRLFYTIWPRFYQLALKQLTSACSWISN